MPAVDKKQIRRKAISLLADGMSQTDTAKSIGVSRITVVRWLKDEEFSSALQAEIARRQARLEEGLRKASDEVIDADIREFRKELKDYHQAMVNVQKMRLGRGKQLFDKAMGRFHDLPEEAISVKDIPAILRIANDLIGGGLDNWADALSLQDVLDRLDGDSD